MMEYARLPVMPEKPMLAQAYVPYQMWSDKLYSLEEGLKEGTIFPELNQPMWWYEWEDEG